MISIPTPCHEDFSKMSKTERGAFCQKCQIDTYDFKRLSNDEIKTVLLQEKGNHICGQFAENQINDLNQAFIVWHGQQPKTKQSRFIFALLFVFGMSLFSCDTEHNQLKGEIEYHEEAVVNDNKPNETINENKSCLDTVTPLDGEIQISGALRADHDFYEYLSDSTANDI